MNIEIPPATRSCNAGAPPCEGMNWMVSTPAPAAFIMPASARCHGPPMPEPEALMPPVFAASITSSTVVYGLSALTVTPAGISARREIRSKLAGVMGARPTVSK